MKLRLVIDAIQAKPAGEVDQRLLLTQVAEYSCRGFERRKLPVGVKNIEFAVILAERRACIGTARVIDSLRRALALTHDHRLENAQQPITIGSEVLQDVDRSALVSKNRHPIRRRHLSANELLRCGERAKLLGRLHRRHIEIECEKSPVLVALAACRFGCDLRPRELPVERNVLVVPRQRRQRLSCLGEILAFANPRCLRQAVLGYFKVICRQARNEIPVFVLHNHRLNHQLHVDREHRPFRSIGGLICADFLCPGESSAKAEYEEMAQASHGQNLSLTVVCKLRIAFAAMGRPN